MFASTKNQIALCQICNFQYKFRDLKPSSYGTWRCVSCYDGQFDLKNHPQNGPFPVVPDPIAVKIALPDVVFQIYYLLLEDRGRLLQEDDISGILSQEAFT